MQVVDRGYALMTSREEQHSSSENVHAIWVSNFPTSLLI
jgi:hypothetical protein